MSFTYLFYQHIMLRRSCGKCRYCNIKRPSDITIADFWGWEKTDPDINKDDKGVSLVIVNTEKGRELFETVKDRMTTIPAKLDDCLQPNLVHPSVMNSKLANFESDYEQYGFEYVMRKYGDAGWKVKLRRFLRGIKRMINRFVK